MGQPQQLGGLTGAPLPREKISSAAGVPNNAIPQHLQCVRRVAMPVKIFYVNASIGRIAQIKHPVVERLIKIFEVLRHFFKT